jgi:hypothetical protein
MTTDDVDEDDMDDRFELDDGATEALLAGDGAADPKLASFLGDARTAYGTALPAVGVGLSAFFTAEPVRSLRVRRSPVGIAAKAAAALAAVLAATGGLAVAGALPAPVQNALSVAASDVGVHDIPSDNVQHSSGSVVLVAPRTTTTTTPATSSVPPSPASTTGAGTTPNHGAIVSTIAHSAPKGCEHGRAVSAAASGKTDHHPCPQPHASSTSTTSTSTTTPASNVHHGNHGHHGPPPSDATPSGASDTPRGTQGRNTNG